MHVDTYCLRSSARTKASTSGSKNRPTPWKYDSSTGMIWKNEPSTNQRRRHSANIMRTQGGPKPGVKPDTPREAFCIYFDHDVVNIILIHTNQRLEIFRESCADAFIRNSKDFVQEEILGVIGVLLNRGVNRQDKDSVRELCSEEIFPLYRATLSEHRFGLY